MLKNLYLIRILKKDEVEVVLKEILSSSGLVKLVVI
jgi:hypothetical protein